ncbi:chromosomal replication initiator protein DnaA [Candidatus Poriferisodalis sp.]|uniref:chromosomal replication initiator protein DnaA n=1 Tax=Candidatus Poriferisodalis sp. TaxID=3101277 RepID=UPI003B594551
MSSPQAGATAHEPEDHHHISQSPGSPSPPSASAQATPDTASALPEGARANTDELWSQCRDILRATVSDALWLGYFRHLQALHIDGELAVLIAPSNMIRDRIQRRYIPMLHAAFEQLPVRPQTYEIETRPELGDLDGANGADADPHDVDATADGDAASPGDDEAWHPATGSANSAAPADNAVTATPTPDASATPRRVPGVDITNPRYTFESFVTGSSNRFAQAAALAVAETPGIAYNPLFIHGGTGLGKTHLLQAIVNFLGATLPEHRVRYVSTETFLSEFIEAIRTNTTPAFKRRYRELDVLLLDDIQFMEGKEGLQEELFHTFNSLHVAGRQIVISSDRPPRSISTLSDRLRSRFEWGLITDIQPPDLETRVAILRKKTEHGHVPDEVLEHIAHLITNNIRELEGALVRVTAYASLTRSSVTLEMAQQILSDVREPQETPITTDRILNMTADMFGYDVSELTSQRRQQGLVNARQISMYVMRELTDLSYPAIASVFGGRDHTTVMHAVKKINSLLPAERKVYDQVAQLIARVRAA